MGLTLPTALILAACTPGFGDDTEPRLGQVPTSLSEVDLVLPLDSYRLTQSEYLTVIRAHWRLTRDCVSRFGMAYSATEADVTTDQPDFARLNARRYGLIDAVSADKRGYNVDDRSPEPDKVGASGRKTGGWQPTPFEHFVVSGKTWVGAAQFSTMPTDSASRPLPDDGCAGEANRKLAAGAARPADENLAENLAAQAYHRSEDDSRVQTAIREWSACMRRAGYSYSSIWEPNDRSWPDPPGTEEISTAKADVSCKLETNLPGVWFAVETAYQQRLIERNAEALAEFADYTRNQVRNASRIVAGGQS